MSHELKDASGKVTCPQLRKYRCPGCGSTGDDAHTRSYCPQLTGVRQQQQQQRQARAVHGFGVGFHSFMPTTSATFLGNHFRAPLSVTPPFYGQQQQRQPVAPISGLPPAGVNYRPPIGSNAHHQDQNNYNQVRYLRQPQHLQHHDYHQQQQQQQQQQLQQQQQRQQLFASNSGVVGAPPLPRKEISPQRGAGSSSDSDDIYLGRSQALNNMSKVTNSRYNSAGRLRHRSGKRQQY